jgi:Protein of unknown function (DUF1573)
MFRWYREHARNDFAGRQEKAPNGLAQRPPRRRGGAFVLLAVTVAALATFGLSRRGHRGGVLVPKSGVAVWEGTEISAPASARAEARFELLNEGDEPVRIVGTESGCGCATPTVDRDFVMPGAAAMVLVSASITPLARREIPIRILTDSKIKREVNLTFRVISSRKPPFLFRVSGVPTSIDDTSLGEEREITVETVEAVEAVGESKSPVIASSLPFVRFEEGGVDVGPHDTGNVLRTRRFLMRLAAPAPGTSVGTVMIGDPWDAAGSMTFNLVVRHDVDLAVSPSAVSLEGSAGSEAVILVRTKEPTDDLRLTLEGMPDPSLSVDRKPVGASRRLHRVRLAVVRAAPPGRIGEIRLRITAPFSTNALTVPVRLAPGIADDKANGPSRQTALVPTAN